LDALPDDTQVAAKRQVLIGSPFEADCVGAQLEGSVGLDFGL